MGKSNPNTNTNVKGSLSQAEHDRMVHEAEEFRAEDDTNRQMVEAKNGLRQVSEVATQQRRSRRGGKQVKKHEITPMQLKHMSCSWA